MTDDTEQKSYWNYRVMYRKYEPDEDLSSYEIHEVHYSSEHEVIGWTTNPVGISVYVDEGLEAIRNITQKINEALQKPVLCYETGKEIKND